MPDLEWDSNGKWPYSDHLSVLPTGEIPVNVCHPLCYCKYLTPNSPRDA